MNYDRAKPFSDLPLLPPSKDVEDIEIAALRRSSIE